MARLDPMLLLLTAACIAVDVAVWSSYEVPRQDFPIGFLGVYLSQTTLVALWVVYGGTWLIFRLPLAMLWLVILSAAGKELQLWGPHESEHLYQATVTVAAANLLLQVTLLTLASAILGWQLPRGAGWRPSQIFWRDSKTLPGTEATAIDQAAPPPADSTTPAARAIPVESTSRSRFTLGSLFDLVTAVAISMWLASFVDALNPQGEELRQAMIVSTALYLAMGVVLVWAILRVDGYLFPVRIIIAGILVYPFLQRQELILKSVLVPGPISVALLWAIDFGTLRLRWVVLRLIVASGLIYWFYTLPKDTFEHTLTADAAQIAAGMAIPLAATLLVLRVRGYRLKNPVAIRRYPWEKRSELAD
ncbi:MAG: hypothetical protein SGJ20_03010 [Planctomycetota bacterium]|nr:hypothetical protein [Planctomycetota bacterium]